jgi:hypothetical protein
MSRLATAVECNHVDGVPLSDDEYAALLSLEYRITELDVFDADRAAALAMVECGECGYHDHAVDMCSQTDGEYLCPGCDYDYAIAYRDRLRCAR